MSPIKVVLADDHEIFRDGFKVMLKKQPQVKLVGEAANGEELIRVTHELQPDVVVTDIKMPRMDGIEAVKRLKEDFPDLGIIALSMFDEDSLIVDMLEAGALGYLLKNAHKNEIVEAIKTVSQHQPYYCLSTSSRLAQLIARSSFEKHRKTKKVQFSDREIDVMRLVCEELSNKEIADRLNLSVRTIEGYRDKIQEKIQARNAAGIVIYAIRNQIYKINS